MRTRTIISLLTVAAALGSAGTGWATSRDWHGGEGATRRDPAARHHDNRDIWRQMAREIRGHLVGPVEARHGRVDRGWRRGHSDGWWERGHRSGAAKDFWRSDERRRDDRGRRDRRHDQRGHHHHHH